MMMMMMMMMMMIMMMMTCNRHFRLAYLSLPANIVRAVCPSVYQSFVSKILVNRKIAKRNQNRKSMYVRSHNIRIEMTII